tara:strand:- start:8148 stop:8744 length:597 start_codon:yes stop_codon:yes gene_type:complete
LNKISQQIIIFFIIIILGTIVYLKYFKKLENTKNINQNQVKEVIKKGTESSNNMGNLIKNLKYNVTFDNKSEYKIFAEFSEITYEDGIEIVFMKKVNAEIIDINASTYFISADNAIFNNSTYNSSFEKNVKITYLDNEILSNNLDLNFEDNIVTIYENVVYEGLQGTIEADNVKMNLLTKNIEISMFDSNKKINISSN